MIIDATLKKFENLSSPVKREVFPI